MFKLLGKLMRLLPTIVWVLIYTLFWPIGYLFKMCFSILGYPFHYLNAAFKNDKRELDHYWDDLSLRWTKMKYHRVITWFHTGKYYSDSHAGHRYSTELTWAEALRGDQG